MTNKAQCQQCKAGHLQGRNGGQSLYNTLTARGSKLTTITEERRGTAAILSEVMAGSDHRDCKKKKRKQSRKHHCAT